MTGSEFWLEAWDEARLCAEPLPTAPECVDWDAVGITIPADATTELTIDWTFLYGSLKPGSYRLGKQILVSGSGGGNENAELHVYFDVA